MVNKINYLETKNKEYESKIQEYEKKFQELIEINKKNEIRINNLEKLINNNTKIEKKIFNSKININETLVKSW